MMFEIGQRYTYPSFDQKTCLKVGEEAEDQGFEIKYGRNTLGNFWVEIIGVKNRRVS